MPLHDNLYKTVSINKTAPDSFIATIVLNRENIIFKAHFPDLPVVPGACLVQISKELISNVIDKKISITSFKNLKFLKTINPAEVPNLICTCFVQEKGTEFLACVAYSCNDFVFCKLDYFFSK